MDKHTLSLFQRKAIKSKEELLQSINVYLQHITTESQPYLDTEIYKPALIELLRNFRNELMRYDLMYLDGPFEAYEVAVTNIGVRLESVDYRDINFNENNEIEESEASVYPPILEIEAPFISIEEFAERHAIDISTVIDWIKDRKMKSVKMEASGWHISALQGIPSDETESGGYIFTGETGDMSDIAPLPKNTMHLNALPQEESEDMFDVMMLDQDAHIIKYEPMDGDTLRSIEDALICSPDVIFEKVFLIPICEKVVPGCDQNPFLYIPQKQIASFVDGLNLPHETKKVLKAMTRSSCGENLFISTLEELSLKEAFLTFAKATMKG